MQQAITVAIQTQYSTVLTLKLRRLVETITRYNCNCGEVSAWLNFCQLCVVEITRTGTGGVTGRELISTEARIAPHQLWLIHFNSTNTLVGQISTNCPSAMGGSLRCTGRSTRSQGLAHLQPVSSGMEEFLHTVIQGSVAAVLIRASTRARCIPIR